MLVSQADRRTEKRSEVGMTNQEAIETIEANYPPANYSMLREALDMAISLLKEQEPVPVKQREAMHMLFWCCGSCGVAITDGDKFCRNCGREVKWNE